MRSVVYLAGARRNLVEINRFISRQSRNRAVGRGVVLMLRGQCEKLGRLPGTLGRPRPELGDGLRSAPVRNYVIFFRYRDQVLDVVNILERHRDVALNIDDELTS